VTRIALGEARAPVFGLVAEDGLAARIAAGLADPVFCREVDWVAPEQIEHLRRWRGLTADERYLRFHDAYRRARDKGFAVHGHFGGGACVRLD
jgi:hypothetical protein